MASVWYIGSSDSKTITSADWDTLLGTSGLGDDTWNRGNGWSIPVASFTGPQLSWLAGQADFNTTAPDGPRTGSTPPAGSPAQVFATPADVDAAVKNIVQESVDSRALSIFRTGLARRHIEPCRIAWPGSSSTFGLNATSPDRTFLGIVTQATQAAFDSGIAGWEHKWQTGSAMFSSPTTLPGVQSLNTAAGGNTSLTYHTPTHQMVYNSLKPHLYVHMIGSNDSTVGAYEVAPEDYEEAVEAAVNSMDTARKASHLYVHTFRRADVTEVHWAEYLAAWKRIQTRHDNVKILDTSGHWELIKHTTPDAFDVISDSDTVHMTDVGHQIMANLILRALGIPPVSGRDPRITHEDSLNRPDGALGSLEYPAGASYSVLSGTIVNQSKRITATAAGTVLWETGMKNLEVSGLLSTGSTAVLQGLLGWAIDDSNRCGVFYNPTSGILQVYKTIAGTTTAIAGATASYSFPNNSQFFVQTRFEDKVISAYINGKRVLTYDATGTDIETSLWNNAAATKAGYRATGVSAGAGLSGLRVKRV